MTDIAAPEVQTESVVGRSRFPVHIVVFLAPALIIYTLFSIYPLVDTIRLSLYAGDETGARHFVGLGNFYTLLSDPAWSGQFWNALRNNLIFFAIHMVVQNGIGLGLAMLLSLPRLTGGSIYRTLLFLPTMLSVVIIGFIWQLMLNPFWGNCREHSRRRRPQAVFRSVARSGIDRPADGLAHLRLAVRRHSDDADLCGAHQHPG